MANGALGFSEKRAGCDCSVQGLPDTSTDTAMRAGYLMGQDG
jgi:hypothetical protein